MGVLVPEVTVVLDRPRRLIEDMNALARWEEVTGLNSRRSDVMVSMVPAPAAPCPECGDQTGAKADDQATEGLDALVWICSACGHRWARTEHRQNLNAAQWSAYVWALLLRDDPSLDDGSPTGGPGLTLVREYLGDPAVYARVEFAMGELQALQMVRAMDLPPSGGGSASEGDPPPGPTSGRPDASTSD